MSEPPDRAPPSVDAARRGPASPDLGLAWDAVADALVRARQRLDAPGAPTDPHARAAGARYLARFLASGLAVCVEHADPAHPEFGRMIEPTRRWGLDMPDCLYLYASVRGDARYRIRGARGTARHLDVQVNAGHFASGDIGAWRTVDSRSGDELEVGADGHLELVLAAERQPGNWLRLEPDVEFVLVRQYFADWERECPADLRIEREDARLPPAEPDPAAMAARLARLAEWLDRGGALWDTLSRGILGQPANTLTLHDPAASGEHTGLRGQLYALGPFACEPDEAVIVRFRPPPCRHWSVSLADFWWESLEYGGRQSSLNGHQAQVDGDGVFRAVIAQRDPGVANWLDPAGCRRGTLALRFLLAEAGVEPQLERVSLGSLAAALPADTPRVAPAEREAILWGRQRAVWRRHRR